VAFGSLSKLAVVFPFTKRTLSKASLHLSFLDAYWVQHWGRRVVHRPYRGQGCYSGPVQLEWPMAANYPECLTD
jgi:hypothetical protein